MDNVASFLSHSAGQSVSAEEVEGMLAIIRGNTPCMSLLNLTKYSPVQRLLFISGTTGDIQVLLYSDARSPIFAFNPLIHT